MGVCAVIGASGYLMFGRNVSDEISIDLAQLKGPLMFLNVFASFSVGLNSLTKIPLGMKMVRRLFLGLLPAMTVYGAR